MPEMVIDERIYETANITGTGEYTLAGAVTGMQPLSVIGANNYAPLFVTDDINWELGLYTYVSGPGRAQRTHVVKSSNGGVAVNWNNANVKVQCGWPAWLTAHRQVSKSVAGSSNVTLTALEQRCRQLILTGALTGNINVIVDDTKWDWVVFNNTSGAYTVTVKTAAGSGVAVAQGKHAKVLCDGTNIVQETPAAASVPAGAMLDFAGTAVPSGFLGCDGSNVSRSTYADLFAAIGTTWGAGNGSTTFTLPDFRRRVSVGSGGTGTGTLGNVVGNTGGAETHTLTTAEMPTHNHRQRDGAQIPAYFGGSGGGAPARPLNVAGSDAVTFHTTDNAGSGTAHNNMQPSAVVLKIIKT